MSTRAVLEIVGWIGSVLVVLSLAQARVWRFRVMNFAGAVLATFYNGILGIWPFAAMNGIIAVIDAYWMVRLKRESQLPSAAYELLELPPDSAYVRHFLKIHGEDARRWYPQFNPDIPLEASILIMRGDETVGLVIIEKTEDGTATVSLDYVTQRFRDLTPGRFVYSDSGLFDRLGVNQIRIAHGDGDYLQRMGFHPDASGWTRQVRPTGSETH
jgi:hypothetical protein